jgi:YYY domain-containing protein
MNIQEFLYILQWWFVLFIAGIAFLPLTGKIFSPFIDKGYAFSKIIGIITVSYIVLVFGIFKLLPFTFISIYVIFLISAGFINYLQRNNLKQYLKKDILGLFIIEELLFFLCLLAWSYVRGFNPEIYGLEKYMDFGFVNTILRSTYFPPVDMWYPPQPINYYYFGHFFTAVLTKISLIPSYITYNLMIATLFALTFIETFSLGITLLVKMKRTFEKSFGSAFRIIIGGILIASLVTLSGNMHVFYSFFKPYNTDNPVPFWNLQFSLINPCLQQSTYELVNDAGQKETHVCSETEKQKIFALPNSYWYPNATRFIHNTIHEFPIYSWVVADLHGHVADIPIVLLTISTLLSFLFYAENKLKKSGELNRTYHRSRYSRLIQIISDYKIVFSFLIGFLISVMYMTNAWDGLTYLMLTFITLLYFQWERIRSDRAANITSNPALRILAELPEKKFLKKVRKYILKHTFTDLLFGAGTYVSIILLTFFIFSRPFSLHFDTSKIVGGIGVVNAPSFLLQREKVHPDTDSYGYDNRNLIMKLFIPDHCRKLMSEKDQLKVTTQYSTGRIGPFLFEPDHCLRSPWWQLAILYGFFYFFVIAFILSLSKQKTYTVPDTFIILLIVTSTILIIIPEFFYMKDIYPDHYRANTMFKLVFQAFIMLSVVSGYTVLKTVSKKISEQLSKIQKIVHLFYILLVLILLAMVFTYPYYAIKSYYNNLIGYQGLDGTAYLKNKEPGDYQAIKWLNTHVKGQPVVLEAQGDSYTDYQRISANTGLPTVIGWYVHEWLWRGIEAPKSRVEDVKNIYESEDIQLTARLLTKYSVRYVVIGPLEKQKYTLLNEDKFSLLGNIVMESGNTVIFKIY